MSLVVRRNADFTRLIFLISLLSGCVQTPAPSVRQHYLDQRLHAPLIDRNRPCEYAKLRPFPFKLGGNHVFIPVALNGVMTIGMVDTGSAISVFTPELAQAAHVEAAGTRGFTMRVLGGTVAVPAGTAHSLGYGSITLSGRVPIHILAFGGSKGLTLGALIGQDLLDHMDYDIDLAHGVFLPYRTRNCLAIDPPWDTAYTGLTITRGVINGENKEIVEFATRLSLSLGVSVPVFFGDKTLDALFDTGAGISVMSRAAARGLGVTDAALAADPLTERTGASGISAKLRLHTFSDVTVGEDVFHRFPIAVIPEFDKRDTAPMILGMDYIAKHHLWLSYTTNALYIDSGEKPSIVRLPVRH